MKSFQPRMKANRPVATSPGRETGSRMRWMMANWPAPSTLAASRSSSGMVSKKPFIIHTHSGSVNVERDDQRQVGVEQPDLAEHQIQRDQQDRLREHLRGEDEVHERAP